jgi:hypothetical protein
MGGDGGITKFVKGLNPIPRRPVPGVGGKDSK